MVSPYQGAATHFIVLLCCVLDIRGVSALSAALIQEALDEGEGLAPESFGEYYWSSRGRNEFTNSYVSYTAPSNFTSSPSWIWENEILGQVRHSPLIDDEYNIYVTCEHSIRKFSQDGNLLWTWEIPLDAGHLNTCPSLYNGEVFALINGDKDGPGGVTVVTLSMEEGTPNWQSSFDYPYGGDSRALSVFDGVMFFGVGSNGVTKVVAGDASDGSFLWEYDSGEVMWNFSPSSPGDGTLIFSSSCGVVTRLSSAGELLLKAGGSHPGVMCGPGGGALGPNGVFYTEFNHESKDGVLVAAYQIQDGTLLWEKQFETGGLQYPAVGPLGSDGPLAVVVAVGDGLMNDDLPLRNKVYALDALTGDVLWESEEKPWYDSMGAGERDPHGEGEASVCYPDPQGIPVITGDGTVYASSSHGGELRAIRDVNGDGQIDDSEVSTFETHKCFLNSPSVAPGMLVVAPCWGPMYVFKA